MADMTVRQPMAGSHESITVSTTALGLTSSKYAPGDSTAETLPRHATRRRNAEVALITVETDAIRWTCDGTTPTAAIGHKASVDDTIRLEGFDAIRLFKAIRVTTDSTLKVTYFGG
jgi:hypothetical protein